MRLRIAESPSRSETADARLLPMLVGDDAAGVLDPIDLLVFIESMISCQGLHILLADHDRAGVSDVKSQDVGAAEQDEAADDDTAVLGAESMLLPKECVKLLAS